MLKQTFKLTAVSAVFLALAACSGGSDDSPAAGGGGGGGGTGPTCGAAVAGPAAALGDTLVLTSCGKLTSFNKAAPQTQVGTVSVTGLTAGETLIGIDYRPATNQLYGVTKSALYVINPTTGVASGRVALSAALTGTNFGVDVNPAVDALRVVSDNDGSFSINFTTGVSTAASATVTPAAASVTASAYTNSFAGAATTRLFAIDTAGSNLYVQNAATSALSAPIGLGVTATGSGGFDIDGANNVGYAALKVGTTTSLYRINLAATAAPAATVVAGGAINVNSEDVLGLTLVPAAGVQTAANIVGLVDERSAPNRLVTFNAATPNTTVNVAITGLTGGDVVKGIDFRPVDGVLWAFAVDGTSPPFNGSSAGAGVLYTINATTGAATGRRVVTGYTTDGGTSYAVDFNPAADTLRVVSFGGQNLAINISGTTAVATEGTAFGLGRATAVAYSNNYAPVAGVTAPAPATRLYTIDQDFGNATNDPDSLNTVTTPSDGSSITPVVGAQSLGIGVAEVQSMDIKGGDNGLVLGALRLEIAAITDPHSLYSIDLATGAATLYRQTDPLLSRIGGATGQPLVDIAIRR